MPARHLLITGKVQGVFFREKAQELAKKLTITGWIKNMDDGSVEAFAEGPDARKLAEFEQWCRQGPPGSHVETFESKELPEEFRKSFEIEM